MVAVYGLGSIAYTLEVRVHMVRALGGVFDRVELSYFIPAWATTCCPRSAIISSHSGSPKSQRLSPMMIVPVDGAHVDDLFDVVHRGGVRVTLPEHAEAHSKPIRGRRQKH